MSLMIGSQARAADAVETFYKDRTIDLVIGGSAGGSFDLYGRLVARFMGRHIPGEPRIVARNMPGASGFAAVQWTATAAPRDGSAFAILPPQLAIQQKLGMEGVKYDAGALTWIGRASPVVEVTYTWHGSPTKKIADAKTRETVMGSPAASSSGAVYLKQLNFIVGTKFRLVTGYPGTTEANLAMERGEIEGTSKPWNGLKSENAEWLRDKKLNILVQYGLTRSPELPDVPTLVELGPTEIDRDAFRFLATGPEMGRPFAAPPGLPPDRVFALRKAFMDTMEDPDLVAEAKRLNIDLGAAPGDYLQKFVADTLAFSPAAIARAKQALD
jgi:tripartite-type tricarboxylate transporter receptor subunit TctC